MFREGKRIAVRLLAGLKESKWREGNEAHGGHMR